MLSFDLDGTLIRKGFDDIFWNERIPELFARKSKTSLEDARKFILEQYDRIGPDDPRWYIPEYWFAKFGLEVDIREILRTVKYAEGVYDDVSLIRDFSYDHTIIISTNNPRIILEHKLNVLKQVRGSITHAFSSVSDFNNIVKGKEFYAGVCGRIGIEPVEMLHVGDDPKFDLAIPRSIGIKAFLIDRERNARGDHVIYSLAEIRGVIGKE